MRVLSALSGPAERRRVIRIIARLNVGGPAIQAITLTDRLTDHGYETTLVRGLEGPDEGTMDYLAERSGVFPVLVKSLCRDPGRHDLMALLAILRVVRRSRPQLVHTHAAKAGTLGRLAVILAFPRRLHRPILIHTFHGHSLTGYFSSRRARVFLAIERVLAKRSDRLIAVSPEVRDELVAMGVAPAESFVVIPLGFELDRFVLPDRQRAAERSRLRQELGIAQDARVVTIVARLVPIKRVDRFLRLAHSLANDPQLHFLVVGDGELREQLQESEQAQELAGRLTWAGLRRDMTAVYSATDVAVLTSDNEGTPVSLIEAQSSGVPVVSTRVGGVPSVVRHMETGLTAPPDDEEALAAAVRTALYEGETISTLVRHARANALEAFSMDRLVSRICGLYDELLEARDGKVEPLRLDPERLPPPFSPNPRASSHAQL